MAFQGHLRATPQQGQKTVVNSVRVCVEAVGEHHCCLHCGTFWSGAGVFPFSWFAHLSWPVLSMGPAHRSAGCYRASGLLCVTSSWSLCVLTSALTFTDLICLLGFWSRWLFIHSLLSWALLGNTCPQPGVSAKSVSMACFTCSGCGLWAGLGSLLSGAQWESFREGATWWSPRKEAPAGSQLETDVVDRWD